MKVGNLPSAGNPAVTWHVRIIREISQDKLGRELVQRYLNELHTVRGSTKAGFFNMLQSELENLQSDMYPPDSSEVQSCTFK